MGAPPPPKKTKKTDSKESSDPTSLGGKKEAYEDIVKGPNAVQRELKAKGAVILSKTLDDDSKVVFAHSAVDVTVPHNTAIFGFGPGRPRSQSQDGKSLH